MTDKDVSLLKRLGFEFYPLEYKFIKTYKKTERIKIIGVYRTDRSFEVLKCKRSWVGYYKLVPKWLYSREMKNDISELKKEYLIGITKEALK